MMSLFLFLIGLSAYAVELKFIGPCNEEFIMRTEVSDEFPTVGDLTVSVLENFKIPYEGTPEELQSAFETPTAEAAVEVVSPEEKRIYGWCFAVNGNSPEIYPHQVPVTPEVKSIVWHFGFTRLYQGREAGRCIPSYTVKPTFLCGEETKELRD